MLTAQAIRKTEEEERFPCLREHVDQPGHVVLFLNPTKGVVVSYVEGSCLPPVGHESDSYELAPENFKPFYGSVVLTQK
jgi:hypothetical protein